MSNAGLARVALGTQVLADANDQAQETKALGEIYLTSMDFSLYENSDKLLAEDANKIFADATLPNNAGQVAADQTQKEIDTTLSDKANGVLNTLIEGRKQELQVLGNNLIEVFSMMEPIKGVLAFFTGILAKKF